MVREAPKRPEGWRSVHQHGTQQTGTTKVYIPRRRANMFHVKRGVEVVESSTVLPAHAKPNAPLRPLGRVSTTTEGRSQARRGSDKVAGNTRDREAGGSLVTLSAALPRGGVGRNGERCNAWRAAVMGMPSLRDSM